MGVKDVLEGQVGPDYGKPRMPVYQSPTFPSLGNSLGGEATSPRCLSSVSPQLKQIIFLY